VSRLCRRVQLIRWSLAPGQAHGSVLATGRLSALGSRRPPSNTASVPATATASVTQRTAGRCSFSTTTPQRPASTSSDATPYVGLVGNREASPATTATGHRPGSRRIVVTNLTCTTSWAPARSLIERAG
jgi:hypothetical protein